MDTLSAEMQTPQRNNNNDPPSFRVQSSSFSSTTLNPSAPEFQVSGVRSGSSAYRSSLFATPAGMGLSMGMGMGMGMGGSYPLGTAAGLMDTTPHVIISGGGGLPPSVACRSPAAAVAGVAATMGGGGSNLRTVSPSPPPPNYDMMEEEIRRDLTPRCLKLNEHMVAVFNLDPKTTQKELTDIFFPCGATDSIILENTTTTTTMAAAIASSSGGKGAGRKAGVVFFKGKDFALRAVKTFDNFAPQRQTQLIVVRYCGPDPAPERRPAAATTTATRTLSDSDVNVLVDLLNKNILESPDRTYVSLHAPEQHILDGILSSIREKMVGSVEYASWPLSSSHLHQYCAAVLKGPVRTAVVSFPHRHIAIPFAREVEQRAVATKTPLRAVVLSGNGKHRGPSSSAAAAAPGLLGVGTGAGFPCPADQSLGGPQFTGSMTDAAALHALSGAGLAEMALGAPSNGVFPAVLGGWSVGGSDSAAAAMHTSSPSATTTTTIVEMLSAIHRQLHANTRFPLGLMLQRLLQHPHFTKNDVKKVVDSIAHAMQDPPLVELLKVLIVEAIDQLHSLEVHPMQADRRHALLSTVGREMLNLVVSTSSTVAELSRDAAGHVAVFCFYFHYLPQTPCSFARCALEKLEPRLHRGERSPDKLDPCLFLTILGVLEHMVEMWKTLSSGVDMDALSFSDMKRRILETCSSLIGDVDAAGSASAGGRSALQLTPSARPTPRPLVTKTSPSSSSSRRDPFRSNNGAHLGGAAPQVKLSMMDSTINGISTDVSVSVDNSLLGGRSDGRRDEQRNECTVFVSPLPGKLTRPQIRRLLVHFGEISKVRLKPKVKHGNGKNDSSKSPLSGSSSVFVEFSTKKEAKRMIDFFSSPDKSFDFLLLEQDETWASDALFTQETVQLLYATAACQARNEIRESHPSDAVYSFASPSSDAGPGSRMLLSACTFGLEDAEGSSMMDTTTSTTTTKMSAHQPTTNNSNPMMMAMHQNDATGISFSDISVEPIPSGNPFYHSFLHSDEDDMDDILHGACKNDDDDPLHHHHHHHGGDDGDAGLEDDDEMVLNFDHRMITAPSQHRQDADEQAQAFNPSLLLFDGTSPVSSIYNEEDRDDTDN